MIRSIDVSTKSLPSLIDRTVKYINFNDHISWPQMSKTLLHEARQMIKHAHEYDDDHEQPNKIPKLSPI